MKRAPCLILGTSCLLLTLAVLVQAQPLTPTDDAQRIIDADAEFLRSLTAKGELGPKSERQVTVVATSIAASADAAMAGDNAKQMATLRSTALALVTAIEQKNGAKIKELAGQLSSKIKADPAANPKDMPWPKAVKFDFVMRAYSSLKVGGMGLEARLDALLEEKEPLSPEKQKEVIDLAYRSAAIAKIADHYKPASDEGMGFNPQNWLKFSEQFRKTSLALADAAKKNSGVTAAVEKLSASCVACHDVFR